MRSPSPREKLIDAKSRLSRSPNNRDTLERALEIIDAALLDHLNSIPAYRELGIYSKFTRLQEHHIIDAAGRAVMAQMHTLRNRSAHANPLYLTPRYVNQYAEIALKVMGSTGANARIKPRKPRLKKPSTQPQPFRSSPTPPARLKPEAPEESIPPIIVELPPVEDSEIVVPELPAEDLESEISETHTEKTEPALQSADSPDDILLLSQLLEIELGDNLPTQLIVVDAPAQTDTTTRPTADNDELLRQLLTKF